MLKTLIFMKRRPGVDRAQFGDWWLHRHRHRIEHIAGLRRYTASVEATSDAAFDGIAELWFDDAPAAAAAWQSVAGLGVDADMRANTSRLERVDVVEHGFVDAHAPAPFKLIAALKRRADLTRAEFAAWWLERHAPLVVVFPELRRYCVNIVDGGAEAFVDGVAEVAFADLATLRRITSTAQVKDVQGDSQVHTSARYRLLVEEMPILAG